MADLHTRTNDNEELFDGLLDRLVNVLRKDGGSSNEPGFYASLPASGSSKIYVGDNGGGGSLWYEWDRDANGGRGAAVGIDEPLLLCKIEDVTYYLKPSEEYGDKEKFQLKVSAGAHNYTIESGITSVFTRSILASLANNIDRVKDDYFYISVAPGTKPKVVMGEVYDSTGRKLMPATYKERESVDMLNEVRRSLGMDLMDGPIVYETNYTSDKEETAEKAPERSAAPRMGPPGRRTAPGR